jgi:hypothetical protein
MAKKTKVRPQKDDATELLISTETGLEETGPEKDFEPIERGYFQKFVFTIRSTFNLLSQEEIDAEEAAQRALEAKEAEEAAFEVLPWIQKCG